MKLSTRYNHLLTFEHEVEMVLPEIFPSRKFYVDIDFDNDERTYEVWIRMERYGVANYMFGLPEEQQSFEEVLDIVEANLEDYIIGYIDEALENEGDVEEE